ncbi:hypothetical protein WJR50_10385 [Catalinimonas sp. 4WD22]|uniref:hypothetical protein n=1 Tax=Catalinimonas locisalis TaxID=3133978 RepID=UPI0031010086
MTKDEFSLLKENGKIGDKLISDKHPEFLETHISYLLLFPDFVYKIKKSVQLPFLDFSSLSQREKYCHQELMLNQRTAPSIYFDVHEIRSSNGELIINGSEGDIVDYCVRLKRIDNKKEMDHLLSLGEVKVHQMDQLAKKIAHFHQRAKIVRKTQSLEHLRSTYSQILEWSETAIKNLGHSYDKILQDSCQISDKYLEQNIDKINARIQNGLMRDVHGDLHSHNIFLEESPIIFDCIEFDEDLRQIDLLNEVAFFLMDLDYYNATELGVHFYKQYLTYMNEAGIKGLEDEGLLDYFKMYRASVRAKVELISLAGSQKDNELTMHKKNAEQYLQLVEKYAKLIV